MHVHVGSRDDLQYIFNIILKCSQHQSAIIKSDFERYFSDWAQTSKVSAGSILVVSAERTCIRRVRRHGPRAGSRHGSRSQLAGHMPQRPREEPRRSSSIRNLAWCHAGHGLDVVRLLRLRVVSQADPVDTCGIEAQDWRPRHSLSCERGQRLRRRRRRRAEPSRQPMQQGPRATA